MVTLLLLLNHVINTKQTNMDKSRELRFIVTNDFVLVDHVFDIVQSVDQFKCSRLCMQSENCYSVNYFTEGKTCELNNKKKEDVKLEFFIKNNGWMYLEKMICQSDSCLNGGTCYTVYQPLIDTFTCQCSRGFVGQFCQTEIMGYRKESPAISCKEIYDQLPSSPSGVYYFKNVSGSVTTPYQAYCVMNMTNGCGGGGWSLVMKIDGNKTTFHYNSTYWSNKRSYGPTAGQTGLDTMETKMPFYWSTPFKHVCLGMRVNHVTRWIKLKHSENSLYDVISSGQYAPLSSNVEQWRSLVPGSSMQKGKVGMGFNIKGKQSDRALINSRARIGLLANNEYDLLTPDSRIGFGTGGIGRDEDDTNSCGNEAASGLEADNDRVSIKAFCYILIK